MNPNNMDSSYSSSTQVQTFIQRVYQWMAIGLALTGFTAYGASSNMALMRGLAGGGFLFLMVAELGLVIWLSASIMKISAQAAMIGFLVYSVLNGLTLSFIFLAYTGASIASTFFITAASFAGVSLFGWATKSDLSSLRGYLFMGLIGMIVASFVNMLFHNPVFEWILSYVGLAVFIGLTAADTQRLKAIHQGAGDGAGALEQIAILGALQLYLDFINMFLLLLRLFGRRR